MSKYLSNRLGFTLLELMIVVIIVAVLAVISVAIMQGRIDAGLHQQTFAVCLNFKGIVLYVSNMGTIDKMMEVIFVKG